jgi:hypothetical protein
LLNRRPERVTFEIFYDCYTPQFPRFDVYGLALSAISMAQRTNVSRDFPLYADGGKPDLVMDPQRFTARMEIVDRYFAPVGFAVRAD